MGGRAKKTGRVGCRGLPQQSSVEPTFFSAGKGNTLNPPSRRITSASPALIGPTACNPPHRLVPPVSSHGTTAVKETKCFGHRAT